MSKNKASAFQQYSYVKLERVNLFQQNENTLKMLYDLSNLIFNN